MKKFSELNLIFIRLDAMNECPIKPTTEGSFKIINAANLVELVDFDRRLKLTENISLFFVKKQGPNGTF